MNFEEIIKPLDDLYTITQMDWDLRINLSLTEPTCPIVCIAPETVSITRYTKHCDLDDVEDTVKFLVNRVVKEIIEGQVLTGCTAPYTNPDDKTIEEWLEKRKTNKDEPFPSKYFYDRYNKQFFDKVNEI